MAQDEMELSWRNVLNYNVDIEQRVNDEWKCIICKRILINAHSGPCGCRYCWRCIISYLDNIDKFCPGESEDCREQVININTNIIIDQAVNKRISKIVVKCPEQFCEFKDELRKIDNHMRLCSSGSDKCPYSRIGCDKNKLTKNIINDHLLTENYSHSNLMIEWIDNLKNEMAEIKRDVCEGTSENQCLRAEINELRIEIREKEVNNF